MKFTIPAPDATAQELIAFQERLRRTIESFCGLPLQSGEPRVGRPVLFLDIDGVLNCRGTPGSTFKKLDPVMIARLNRVVEAVNPIIVLSSAWGLNGGRTEQVLHACGFVGHLEDETPTLDECDRGTEIGAWLSQHPWVLAFAILDDDSDMGPLLSHLVQTSWVEGLQDQHVDEVIRRLTPC